MRVNLWLSIGIIGLITFGILALAAGSMGADSFGKAVQHEQPPFAGGRLHPGGLTHYHPVRHGELFPGAERAVLPVEPPVAIRAGNLLLPVQHKHQVYGHFLLVEVPECGNHGHHAAAVVIGTKAVDYLGIIPGIEGAAGISLIRGYGIDVGVHGQGRL